MPLIRTLLLGALILIGLSSCGKPPGFDRPMNQKRQHGFHRGGGYGHGAGHYNPGRRYNSYRHYR
jgi:hypothetical protein